MRGKLDELLGGVDVFAERTSMGQQAAEILGRDRFNNRIRDLYQDIAGWHRKDDDAMDLDEYGVLPEFLMSWYPGMVHQLWLERAGWFQLEGTHIRLCERGRFSNRFEAYDYLAQGERPVCLVSSARYWGLRLWSDTPEDIARLKAAGKWRTE